MRLVSCSSRLEVPGLEAQAEAAAGLALPAEDLHQGVLAEAADRFLLGQLLPVLGVALGRADALEALVVESLGGLLDGTGILLHELGGHDLEVAALVAVLGELHRPPALLHVVGAQRGPQEGHLPAGVVDVVLGVGVVAHGVQQADQGHAEGAGPRRDDVQRTGGIGADELDVDALAAPGLDLLQGTLGVVHVQQLFHLIRARHPEVDEARPGDLHRLDDILGKIHGGGDLAGQFARLDVSAACPA